MNLSIKLIVIIKLLFLVLPLLIAVAYLTLYERKLMASIQRRRGPNKVGFLGLFQALSDGLKLLLKETILPGKANRIAFIIAPIASFALSLLAWAVIPFQYEDVFSDINFGILYLFSISSLHVYGIILAGWASNSKYAFLGALRCAAQLISYEISMGLILIPLIMVTHTFNLIEIVDFQRSDFTSWLIFPFFPLFILFFISTLAETNRPPFDLAEAEAELVAGYSTEYSAMSFALFFLGEYVSIILMSSFITTLFLGGWHPMLADYYEFKIQNLFDNTLDKTNNHLYLNDYYTLSIPSFIPGYIWFSIKVLTIVSAFVIVRAAYPRLRYDQLMSLGWKCIFPFTLGAVIISSSLIYFFCNIY